MTIISKKESSFAEFLEESNIINFVHNDRTVLKNRSELDFYLPDYKLGFEINPASSHSETGLRQLDYYYHQNKALDARNEGVKLTHLYDWANSRDKPVWSSDSFLRYVQGLIIPEQVKARSIVEIDDEIAQNFLQQYDLFHLLFDAIPEKWLGVFDDNDNLLMVLCGESEILSSKFNQHLSWRYVGLPDVEITNFWDIWPKNDTLLLMTSLDTYQIGIPMNSVYQLTISIPSIHLCKGTGRNYQMLSVADFIQQEGSWIVKDDWRFVANDLNYNIIHDAGYLVCSNKVIV